MGHSGSVVFHSFLFLSHFFVLVFTVGGWVSGPSPGASDEPSVKELVRKSNFLFNFFFIVDRLVFINIFTKNSTLLIHKRL